MMCTQGSIIKLPSDIRSTIRSNININGYLQCILELIYNSLDANATSIAIRIDLKKHKIQVVDNGSGILPSDMQTVGKRYMTSKCKSLHDLQHNLNKFGYRGEALASVINMSKSVSVMSLHYEHKATYKKSFHKGIEDDNVQSVKMRPTHGTTITISDFMYNLGVRQKRVDPVLDMEEIRLAVETVALINFHISFSIRDDSDGRLVLKTHKSKTIREAFFFLLDERVGDTLQPIEIEMDSYKMDGYVAKGTHNTRMLQYVYVNKRPIKHSQMQKWINDLLQKQSFLFREHSRRFDKMETKTNFPNDQCPDLKSNFNGKKFPVFVVNISCPYTLYDTTCLPDKSLIQFKNWKDVQRLIHAFVREFVKKELGDSADGEIVEEIVEDEIKKRTLEQEEGDLVKTVLWKNAADFGASQLQNAIKGIPAKRKSTHRERHSKIKKLKESIEKKCNPAPEFFTPKQNVSLVRKNMKRVKTFKKLKKNSQLILSNVKNMQSNMRETPLILSQLFAGFKKPVVKQDLSKRDLANTFLNDVGVNSALLLKSSHNLKVTEDKNKITRESHTSITQSTVIHMKYNKNINPHMLKGQSSRNENIQKIKQWLNNKYFNEPRIGVERTIKKVEQNYTLKNVLNESDNKMNLSKTYYKNLKEYTIKIPRKLSKSNYANVKHITLPRRAFKTTHDMIKTIIEPKATNIIVNNGKKQMFEIPSFDWNEFKSKVNNNMFSMKPYSLKDFGVQTDLCFKDLEILMQNLENKYQEIENYERGRKEIQNSKQDYVQKEICDSKHDFTAKEIKNSVKYFTQNEKQSFRQDRGQETQNDIQEIDSRSLSNMSFNNYISSIYKLKNDSLDQKKNCKNEENLSLSHNKCNETNMNKIKRLQDLEKPENTASVTFNISDLDKSLSIDIDSYNDHLKKRTCEDLCINQIIVKQTPSFICESDSVKNVTSISENIHNFSMDSKRNGNQSFKRDVVEEFEIFQKISNNDGYPNNDSVDESAKNKKNNFSSFREICELHDSNEFIQSKIKSIENTRTSNMEANTKITEKSQENFTSLVSATFKNCLEEEFNKSYDDNQELICTTKSMSILKTPNSYYVESVSDRQISNRDDNNYLESLKIIKDDLMKIPDDDKSPIILSQNKMADLIQDEVRCTTPVVERNNEWDMNTDSFGKVFYINTRTGMTVYEKPNIEENTTCPYTICKRPGFLPKGMSPILKLGKTALERSVDSNPFINTKVNATHDPLSKVKWDDLYYKEALYDDFATELRKNRDALEIGIDPECQNLMRVKNYCKLNPLVFDRALLNSVKVVNQVDTKFIATIVEDPKGNSKFLTLFDQHAVHERIRLEYLLNEFQEGNKWKSVSITKPLIIDLQQYDIVTLLNYKESFENLGLTFQKSKLDESKIEVTSIPSCFQCKELNEDDSLLQLVDQLIAEELDIFKVTRGNTSSIPAAMMKVISSKACHGAIKFGMELTKQQCEQMIKCLAKCRVPFQCAHGRPVLSILADFNDTKYTEVKKLNFKNLKNQKKKMDS